jgi:DNA polymerase III gamma/tau subunit
VKSRCDKYEFTRITPAVFAPRAQSILQHEGLTLTVDEVKQYLQRYTTAHSDVRDYLRVMDKILSLDRAGMLPPPKPGETKPNLTLVV